MLNAVLIYLSIGCVIQIMVLREVMSRAQYLLHTVSCVNFVIASLLCVILWPRPVIRALFK